MIVSHASVDTDPTRAPFRTSLLVLVGLFLLAASVVGYVALQNELSYRAIMRDPVRVEADLVDGGPSGRFGYFARYRFTAGNLQNTDTIHVNEADWQWISASRKVPVIYARDNPRLFEADPDVYRRNATREAKVASFLLLLAFATILLGRYSGPLSQEGRTYSALRRSTPTGLAVAGLVFSVIASLLAAGSIRNAVRHQALKADMQATNGEVLRTWHISVGKSGHKLGMRLQLADRLIEVEAPNRDWNHVRVGEQVTIYYAANRPDLFSLSPTSFRNDAILFAFGAAVMIGYLISIRVDYRNETARLKRLRDRHELHRATA